MGFKLDFVPDPNKPLPSAAEKERLLPDPELATKMVRMATEGHGSVAKAINTLGAAIQMILLYQAEHGAAERAANNAGLVSKVFAQVQQSIEQASVQTDAGDA